MSRTDLDTIRKEAEDKASHGDFDRSKDYYGILCLAGTVNQAAIRSAYHKQSLLVHPDKIGKSGTNDQFIDIEEACAVLSDQRCRALYDEERDRLTQQLLHGTSEEGKIKKIIKKLPYEYQPREPGTYCLKPKNCSYVACNRSPSKALSLTYSYAPLAFLRYLHCNYRTVLFLKAPAPPSTPQTAPVALSAPQPSSPSSPPPRALTAASTPVDPPAPTPTIPSAIASDPLPSGKKTLKGRKRRRASNGETDAQALERPTKASEPTTSAGQPRHDAKIKHDQSILKRKKTIQTKKRNERIERREQKKELAKIQAPPAKGAHQKGRNKFTKKQQKKRDESDPDWEGG